MTIDQVKQLKHLDEVYWNDPDEGLCSRFLVIGSLRIVEDQSAVVITDIDGDCLHAWLEELE